jgi:hypothetical protein
MKDAETPNATTEPNTKDFSLSFKPERRSVEVLSGRAGISDRFASLRQQAQDGNPLGIPGNQ